MGFSGEASERLEEIRKLGNHGSGSETVRASLRLYEWYLKKKSEGYELQLVKDHVVKKPEFLF